MHSSIFKTQYISYHSYSSSLIGKYKGPHMMFLSSQTVESCSITVTVSKSSISIGRWNFVDLCLLGNCPKDLNIIKITPKKFTWNKNLNRTKNSIQCFFYNYFICIEIVAKSICDICRFYF